jgi:lysozyme
MSGLILSNSELIDSLRQLLIEQEGLELHPYHCTQGKLTIGVGRNLEDVGISESEAMMLLENDLKRVCLEAEKACPWLGKLTSARQAVILSMTFNMGIRKVLEFTNMIGALEVGDYNKASHEMLSSLWARQVQKRAKDLAVMMKLGKF